MRIVSVVSEKWESIKTGLGGAMESIKSGLSEGWNAAKSTVTSVMNSISGKVTSVWNTITSSIGGAVDSVKSSISDGFNAAKTTASNIFNSIRTTISNAINGARTTVSNAISAIRNVFNFQWSLPKLKLPHFSVSGSFSLNPLSVPHLSISWYKKAMDKGIIMDKPTIFGAKGSELLAGGEAGSETVVGTNSLMGMIRDAVKSMVTDTTINYGGVNINVYAKENQDVRALADEIEYRINNNVMRRRAAVGV